MESARAPITLERVASAFFHHAETVLRPMVEALPMTMWATDLELRLSYAHGLPAGTPLRYELAGLPSRAAGDEHPQPAVFVAHRTALGGENVDGEFAIGHRVFRLWLVPLCSPEGRIEGVAGCAIDLTDSAQTIELLRSSEEKLAVAQSAASLGSWDFDLVTEVMTCSDELFRLVNLEPGDSPSSIRRMRRYIHPEDRMLLDLSIAAACDARTAFTVDTRVVLPDGEERWIEHRGRYRYFENEPVGIVGTALDITARKLAETTLAHQSHFDALTNLPNRKLLVDRLQQAIGAAQRSGTLLAVFVVDLDRFKIINDTLGHAAGDALLRAAAPRIASALRDADTVARAGGDEFVIVLPSIDSPESAARLARDLNDTLAEPFDIENRELYTTASIGISLCPTDGETADQLIRNADAAMYRAKESGRNTFCFYAPSIHARAVDRLVLENQLRRALENGEFAIHYQPIVDANDAIVAVESLLRWNHPLLGTIRPDAFIPLCEEIGLIVPIGRWVVRTAIAQMVAWRERGCAPQRLAINVSGRQLVGSEFPRFVAETLRDYDYRAAALELEITESAVMGDLASAAVTLAELKSLGTRLVLDDFGTGYSSLAYLKAFRVDAIKIDRSFVKDLPHDRTDAAIVSAVVALGDAMGVRIVAEGVETAAQAALVRKLGCHELQGYHFWRPLPANEIETVLRAQRVGGSSRFA